MASTIPFTFQIYRGDDLEREESITAELPGVVKIGKLESSHLRLDDDGVSRMHAVVDANEQGEVHVIDLGSASGTIVNGQKVNKAQLQDGDELTLGALRVVVKIGQPSVAEAPAALQPAEPVAPTVPQQPEAAAPAVTPPAPAVAPPPGIVAPPSVAPAFGPPAVPVPGMVQQAPQPAPMAQEAYVPPVDPTLDRQDGSRAIEVTALFHDSVLAVEHLDNPARGKVGALTWGLLVVGWGTFIAAIVVMALGQAGLGGLMLTAGLGVGVFGAGRFFDEKKPPHFALGEAVAADVNVKHPAVPVPYFPLVMSNGTDFSLLYTSQMNGDVTIGADRTELSSLAESGRAHTAAGYPNAYSYSIPQDARIKVDMGEHTFLINSVAPARPVVSPFLARVNWSAQVSTGLSFAAHALLLFLVFAIPPDAKALSLDLFNTDNKFVKYLVKPPEMKDEQVPDWLKKNKGPDKPGGKGQKHKGEEGKMGKKTSKKKTGLYGLKGPKDNPDPHMAKRLAENAAQHAGVLGLLKSSSGSHLASIFGRDSALGTDAEDALGGLIGDSIGESYGVGGLGLSGTGRGGGGTGAGTIGLGTLGTIGKGGGGGGGSGYARAHGRLRGRRARAPRVIAGRAQVRGALDKEIIRRIIRRHINEVKYCYQKELAGNAKLGGRVQIRFTIAGTGRVILSKVQSSTVGNRVVEKCIARAVRRWLFPKPKGGGIVIVTYPFVLRTAGQ